jgi:hypothetical protein
MHMHARRAGEEVHGRGGTYNTSAFSSTWKCVLSITEKTNLKLPWPTALHLRNHHQQQWRRYKLHVCAPA